MIPLQLFKDNKSLLSSANAVREELTVHTLSALYVYYVIFAKMSTSFNPGYEVERRYTSPTSYITAGNSVAALLLYRRSERLESDFNCCLPNGAELNRAKNERG